MKSSSLLAVTVRILIAVFTCTFFQPDEYFQSLEPAHHLVFGYGCLTWEWLAERPVRSILYPALNVPVYWLLKVLRIDGVGGGLLLIASPRVIHGAFAAATDVWVCELTRRVLGERYISTVLFISLTSFFHALSLSRSLSNSLETSLTTIAFAYYPWDTITGTLSLRSGIRKGFIFSAMACVIRPTNAVIWVYMYLRLLWRLRSQKRVFVTILVDLIVIGFLSLSIVFALDSMYYHRPTFTPLNFLLTNLSHVSVFYGANPWHYYLTQALPVLCATALPFVLHGAWIILRQGDARLSLMLQCVVWTISVYSLAGHKEWRFLHPLLPLLHVLAAKSLVDSQRDPKGTLESHSNKFKTGTKATTVRRSIKHRKGLPIRTTHLAMLCLSLPASVYVVFFYRSAPISVMAYLRQLPAEELHGSVGFLMPCHSTPWQAYLHKMELAADGRIWALGCEPPLNVQNLTAYRDQASVFYESPGAYMKRFFPPEVDPSFPPSPFPTSIPGVVNARMDVWEYRWPRYLVLFGSLLDEDGVRSLLEDKGYAEVWRTRQEWDGEMERRGGIRVWRCSQ